MTSNIYPANSILLLFIGILVFGCKSYNHIEKYGVDIDSLKTLPDGFYAYRGGRVYQEEMMADTYRVWFNLDDLGNIENIEWIQDLMYREPYKTSHPERNNESLIADYKIDTLRNKTITQKFIDLSKKFRFGHLLVDKKKKISFSVIDGLPEQYTFPLQDSVTEVYFKNPSFKKLPSGWFVNVENH